MFSASPSFTLQPRAAQLCRVLLRVRIVVAVLAVLLLGSSPLSWTFALAFVFAVVTSVLAYVFWRRLTETLQRHPILLSLDTFISLFVLTLGERAAPFMIFTVVSSAMAGLLYRWGGMLYIVVLQVACYVTAATFEVGSGQLAEQQSILVPALYYPLVGLAGLWMRRLLDDADRSDEARRAVEVDVAAERERTRLAGDLHDSLAKTVRGIALSAAALPSWIRRDPDRASREASNIAAAAEVASREARDLLGDLRSGQLGQPLVPTVQQACESWAQRTGIDVSLHLPETIDLDSGPGYETVNVLKEALTNIERHARAGSVIVRLSSVRGEVRLSVADDGVGFDTSERDTFAEEGHYGLLGMTERARRAGGELTVASSPGRGSEITLALAGRSCPAATQGANESPRNQPHSEVPMEAR